MSEHFIKNIEIKNFKCFNHFKAEGFARVNLIGGKNNVGKTAFMESLYINLHATNYKSFARSMYYIQCNRADCESCKDKTIEYIKKCAELDIKSNIRVSKFNISDLTFNFQIDNKNTPIEEQNLRCDCQCTPKENINFIHSCGLSNNDIKKYYGKVEDEEDEIYLDELLQQFDPSIKKFQIRSTGELRCKINDNFIELTDLGDGTQHLISLVTSLYASKNGYLFLDELDNGIHYTFLNNFWEIILETSKKLNVQVFATTHSKECIESYARVAKRLEEEDTKFIELFRDNDEIKTIILDNEILTYQLEQNHEVR